MKFEIICATLAAIGFAASAFAGQSQYGEQPPDNIPKMTLEDLAKNADAYADKTVLVTGVFYGVDPDGDDFYLKDQSNIIEVAPPPNTKIMSEGKSGTPVAVYGKVIVKHRGEKTVLHMVASGVGIQ